MTLAPCTRRGKATGPAIPGVARRLEGTEAEQVTASLFTSSLRGRVWMLLYRLRGWEPVLYEVSPVIAGEASRAA